MREKEIELVAELLAKLGGTWFPERANLGRKMVTGRQREVARLIVAELERTRAAIDVSPASGPASESPAEADARSPAHEGQLSVGSTVEYCPPGDKRTVICQIQKIDNGRAYVTPVGRVVGWVSTHTLLPLKS
jgi:hypothetical protein